MIWAVYRNSLSDFDKDQPLRQEKIYGSRIPSPLYHITPTALQTCTERWQMDGTQVESSDLGKLCFLNRKKHPINVSLLHHIEVSFKGKKKFCLKH